MRTTGSRLRSPLMPAGDADAQISGYSIIEADSSDQLAELLSGHPHTAAGGTITTQEFQGMPGM